MKVVGGVRCRHMAVDDDSELDRKRNGLRVLLDDNDWVVGGEGQHIEESVKEESVIRCDPGIVNKEIDSHHIDLCGELTPPPFAWYL